MKKGAAAAGPASVVSATPPTLAPAPAPVSASLPLPLPGPAPAPVSTSVVDTALPAAAAKGNKGEKCKKKSAVASADKKATDKAEATDKAGESTDDGWPPASPRTRCQKRSTKKKTPRRRRSLSPACAPRRASTSPRSARSRSGCCPSRGRRAWISECCRLQNLSCFSGVWRPVCALLWGFSSGSYMLWHARTALLIAFRLPACARRSHHPYDACASRYRYGCVSVWAAYLRPLPFYLHFMCYFPFLSAFLLSASGRHACLGCTIAYACLTSFCLRCVLLRRLRSAICILAASALLLFSWAHSWSPRFASLISLRGRWTATGHTQSTRYAHCRSGAHVHMSPNDGVSGAGSNG
ncbi:hypothetical protein K438DRAFT_61235 [Mycena galopus ATCC 62051]|nr:hypothetical protein K438DRAFT_61235 [Mycena galopus ATCC 62051]